MIYTIYQYPISFFPLDSFCPHVILPPYYFAPPPWKSFNDLHYLPMSYIISPWICPHIIFSSPEPKAQLSYCHSASSVVRPSVRRPASVRRPSVNFHIFDFFSRTAWWILMKLGRYEVLMVPYKCCCFSARSAQGRIQGGGKSRSRGVPFFKNLLLQTGRLQQQTECIAMI